MGKDNESKSTRIRWWLSAVRYVIAGAVTVLTVAVIAWAIVQSLRPEALTLSIDNGYVTIDKIKSMSQPVSVNISLMIHANNPSGRASIWYDNVIISFLYSNSSQITYLQVASDVFYVAPLIEKDAYVSSKNLTIPEDVPMDFVQKMFEKKEIKNATVTLEGVMRTQISALNFTRGIFTKYFCSSVTIGTSPQNGDEDIDCDKED